MNNVTARVIPTAAREERAGEVEESAPKRKAVWIRQRVAVTDSSTALRSARNDGQSAVAAGSAGASN
jgi:hypothetical protein